MTSVNWEHDHILHIGGETETPENPEADTNAWRKRIEPWLSAVFQSEHLSLLLGNGFSCATMLNTTMSGGPISDWPKTRRSDEQFTNTALLCRCLNSVDSIMPMSGSDYWEGQAAALFTA